MQEFTLTASSLKEDLFDYCPGCSHSHLHSLLGQVIDRNNWQARVIGICSSGCSMDMFRYFNFSFIQAPPGKAPDVAAGLKRADPSRLVFTYQGDGDLLSSGLDSLLHAAMRGESLTVICLNNLVMAAPGGQMSLTSSIGQVTATTPLGRSSDKTGQPIRLAELVARFPGVAFVQRVALHEPDFVHRATLALKDAFLHQESGGGLSFVEVLGSCPPYWQCSPVEARQKIKHELLYQYPTGIFRRQTLKA